MILLESIGLVECIDKIPRFANAASVLKQTFKQRFQGHHCCVFNMRNVPSDGIGFICIKYHALN